MARSIDDHNELHQDDSEEQLSLGKRLAWFGGLWVLGVVGVAGFAYGLRALIGL